MLRTTFRKYIHSFAVSALPPTWDFLVSATLKPYAPTVLCYSIEQRAEGRPDRVMLENSFPLYLPGVLLRVLILFLYCM